MADAIRIIAGWLRLIVAPGAVTEVRAVDIPTQYGRPYVESGYFDYDHLEQAATEAARLSLKAKAKGIYFVLNPIAPDLLARRANRVGRVGEGDSTGEKHITGRRWLLVDADPARDAKISSSDAEKAQALAVVRELREFLAGRAWPAPILADSGNGYHLLYRIDPPGGRRRSGQARADGALPAVHQRRSDDRRGGPQLRPPHETVRHSRAQGRRCSVPDPRSSRVPAAGDTGLSRPVRHHHGRRAGRADGVAGGACRRGEGSDEGRAPPGPRPSTNGHGYQHRLDVGKRLGGPRRGLPRQGRGRV